MASEKCSSGKRIFCSFMCYPILTVYLHLQRPLLPLVVLGCLTVCIFRLLPWRFGGAATDHRSPFALAESLDSVCPRRRSHEAGGASSSAPIDRADRHYRNVTRRLRA